MKSDKSKHNRLIHEKSPYLQQHADNPVDWYPWGDEAFEKARKENKPIFLSIGYSTCHWCHVMEHESFEDEDVARLMNEAFVNIKVDREERPDIDAIYMTVCQLLTQRGGWPLTIIMTPDKKPFFAGTYFPRESRFGQIGMMQLIPRVREIWTNQYNDILVSADKISESLREVSQYKPGKELDETVLKSAFEQLVRNYDSHYGGFSSAPKFPTPHNLLFLLRYWKRTENVSALAMVEKTLQALRQGGVYDHIGFGFHRYSTDRQWLVPHFEKMLYDQALLAIAYIETYQATANEIYKKTAEEIFTYVLRDMTSPEGGFYSAEDADSEGKEGKFYLWSAEEIKTLLGEEDAELFMNVYNIDTDGNYMDEIKGEKNGLNIIHLKNTINTLSSEQRMSEQKLSDVLEVLREKLFAVRKNRVHPHKDDKILTDWNGLMIAALAKGARVFDNPVYMQAAEKAADFVLRNMISSEGRLLHRFRNGDAGIQAHIDDYAFLIWGLLELYETTFKAHYLQKALKINQELIDHFWDVREGGFYLTADDAEQILTRRKEIYDGALPSGNSVSMMNLLRLARLTATHEFEEKASAISRIFSDNVIHQPLAYTYLLNAVDFVMGPSYEIVIAGDNIAKNTKSLLHAIHSSFIPNKVVLFHAMNEESSDILKIAGYLKNYSDLNGETAVYVCRNYKCELPTADKDTLLKLLH